MILIVNMCKEKLSELEFVKPLQELISNNFVTHYSEITKKDINSADKIILTGTALADFEYLKGNFTWMKDCRKPILGICAGMQAVAKAFNWQLVEQKVIGVHQTKIVEENSLVSQDFSAYFLHAKGIKGNFKIIAKVKNYPCMIKHPELPIYGCSFHPEVLNEEIIERFVKLK